MSFHPQLVVGTAGHIDHGKSRLVWHLTGTNPDRLPEEQARGMTIDLGFAHAEINGCDISFVDVPGHERFVRHMIAGATGVDAALLVVAADDGVMPQTREHAELLALLGVSTCLLVITKTDLVTPERVAEVEAQARSLLAGLRLSARATLHTSAETGQGFDELRRTLAELARSRAAQPRVEPAWFRLPIDRVFTVAGRGTVVTGTVWHGRLERGAELQLLPGGERVRARDVQTHNQEQASIAGRLRLGVNIAGWERDQISRGGELATPGYLQPTTCIDAWLDFFRPRGDENRRRIRARVLTATSDVPAVVVRLPEATESGAGEYVQLRLAQPLVVEWNQRFVIRDESGQQTLGGGRFLWAFAARWAKATPPDPTRLAALRDGADAARLEAVLALARLETLRASDLCSCSGMPDAATASQVLQEACWAVEFRAGEGATWVHRNTLAALQCDLEARLKKFAVDHPRAPGVPRADWVQWMPGAADGWLRPLLAQWLLQQGFVVERSGYILLAGSGPELSASDRRLYDDLIGEYATAGLAPPALEGLRCANERNRAKVRELIKLAVAQGELIRIADGLWFHVNSLQAAMEKVADLLRSKPSQSAAEIKATLGMTRKYAIPLVEYFDAIGLTRRTGDLRILGPRGAGRSRTGLG